MSRVVRILAAFSTGVGLYLLAGRGYLPPALAQASWFVGGQGALGRGAAAEQAHKRARRCGWSPCASHVWCRTPVRLQILTPSLPCACPPSSPRC